MNFSRSNGLRIELQTASAGIFSTPRLPAAERLGPAGGEPGETPAIAGLALEHGALAFEADDVGDEPPARPQFFP